MIDPDTFHKLSNDPDIPEDILIGLLAFLNDPCHEELSDEELRLLYEADEANSQPAKKAPIDHNKCPFLTTKQAAHYVGLSFRTLEKMRMDNNGPSYRRHGRYIRYHTDDLEAWSKGQGRVSASNKSPR